MSALSRKDLSTAPMPAWAKAVLALAVLCVVATWSYLVITQPTDSQWESLADSHSSTIALVGFLVPAILALIVIVPRLPVRTLGLLPVALALNIILGQVIGTMGLPVPLYLDSIGTVLVGSLAGPAAGMTTGILSSLIWGTFNPTVVPFAAAYAFVGIAAGLLRKLFLSAWWKVALVSLVVGFITALLSAPVASFIFGGTAGTGTGLLVSFYRSLGFDTITAVFLQSWTSDPIDKLIVFTIVWLVIRALPQRARRTFAPEAKEGAGAAANAEAPATAPRP
nr:ECF transporter S component [Corynebacterium sp. zg254]